METTYGNMESNAAVKQMTADLAVLRDAQRDAATPAARAALTRIIEQFELDIAEATPWQTASSAFAARAARARSAFGHA